MFAPPAVVTRFESSVPSTKTSSGCLGLCHTVEIRIIVRVTCTFVYRDLRVWTERARHADSFGGVVFDVLGGDDGAWRGALFDPLFERVVNAMFRPLGSGGAQLAE